MSGMICLWGAYCALRMGISGKGGKVAKNVVLHNRFYNKKCLAWHGGHYIHYKEVKKRTWHFPVYSAVGMQSIKCVEVPRGTLS